MIVPVTGQMLAAKFSKDDEGKFLLTTDTPGRVYRVRHVDMRRDVLTLERLSRAEVLARRTLSWLRRLR